MFLDNNNKKKNISFHHFQTLQQQKPREFLRLHHTRERTPLPLQHPPPKIWVWLIYFMCFIYFLNSEQSVISEKIKMINNSFFKINVSKVICFKYIKYIFSSFLSTSTAETRRIPKPSLYAVQ